MCWVQHSVINASFDSNYVKQFFNAILEVVEKYFVDVYIEDNSYLLDSCIPSLFLHRVVRYG